MKNYIVFEEWKIIENTFDPKNNEISESLFSLGNGQMGHRGNFEERYSGKTLQGNYIAGVYYPDKTRVGWWKNGYPEYFAKVLNATAWIGIDIQIGTEILDLHTAKVLDFSRILNMKEGILERNFTAELLSGKQIKVKSERFCAMKDDLAGAIRYTIEALNFSDTITITSSLDGNIKNKDSNYDEKFWDFVGDFSHENAIFLHVRTKKTGFDLSSGARTFLSDKTKATILKKDKFIAQFFETNIIKNNPLTIEKFATQISSLQEKTDNLAQKTEEYLQKIIKKGFEILKKEQIQAWDESWQRNDIVIEGDPKAQQGIRFCIFQLNQTYTGKDARLNIGPKGFTGEKYGGSTYWDTEAYCIPFYLATAPKEVARQLLVYRHNQLQKAIENAEKLGFSEGAALYPMVTMNGEECHNEWEITFEEIHRNGAIAYAIFDYIRYTGDEKYLNEYGLEVLIGIARFWKQRVNWSESKQKYVMLGVTGPNEYENNVNNNWYTNFIAQWCLKYALESLEKVKKDTENWTRIAKKINWEDAEIQDWQHIIDYFYFPEDSKRGVFLQQEGFLDKDLKTVDKITKDRPINQKWSWDRILRSCFIKQADVLQGLYLFDNQFDTEILRRNFDFYEPMTVHESSLSPCIHSILATRLGYAEKAYEMYLRTARLDLDDYNNDTEDGLHITSMAGSWMAVVIGFGGLKVQENRLYFSPVLPKEWTSFSYKMTFRGTILEVLVKKDNVILKNLSENPISVVVMGEERTV